MKNVVDQLRRHIARVIPFAVIADPEIKHVDIFIAIARINVKKEERIKHHKEHHQKPDRVGKRCGGHHDNQRGQPGGVHGNKQSRMFADKADAKARAIVALFTGVEIVDGGGEQALYLCHFLPS
ncbi:hypothetical protein ENTCAN_07468 [Enterobacter cancerogenus ATCC 35316]|nr:hypothetical protein ENTCAN_07468 [Enterobacter cancerogenus ATCC 35316]